MAKVILLSSTVCRSLEDNKSIDWKSLLSDSTVFRPTHGCKFCGNDIWQKHRPFCIDNGGWSYDTYVLPNQLETKDLKKITLFNGLVCDLGQVSIGTISALVQDLKFYEQTGRYEERINPMVYMLGNDPPTVTEQAELGITSSYRKLLKRDIDMEFNECNSGSATAAKVVNVVGFKLRDRIHTPVKFINANTHNAPTLNITSTGPKEMWHRARRVGVDNQILTAGIVITFAYNELDDRYDVVNITKDIVECGWILPSDIKKLLRGYTQITINGNTWFEKRYGKFVYEIS